MRFTPKDIPCPLSPVQAASWMVGNQYKPAELGKLEWDVVRDSPPWAIDAWGLGCLIQEICSCKSMKSVEDLRCGRGPIGRLDLTELGLNFETYLRYHHHRMRRYHAGLPTGGDDPTVPSHSCALPSPIDSPRHSFCWSPLLNGHSTSLHVSGAQTSSRLPSSVTTRSYSAPTRHAA